LKAFVLEIKGIVQGIGFRPFVYRLAHLCSLKGYVLNSPGSVKIHVEGKEGNITRFLKLFPKELPRGALVVDIKKEETTPLNFTDFVIEKSRIEGQTLFSIPPDMALCEKCESDIFDPKNRRYLYPFTNCTGCGPRFTIAYAPPYDRENTSMKTFFLCPSCGEEYGTVEDRRYHAEPNGCPDCGPSLSLLDSSGKSMSGEDPLAFASVALGEEKIVALKGLGGYHLAVDGTSDRGVEELRKRKLRKGNPFAVMVENLDMGEEIADLSPSDRKILSSREAPILVTKVKNQNPLSSQVAPGLTRVGIFLPYTPLHRILMRQVRRPLVMTSGNVSEEPIAVDNEEAITRLSGIADYYVTHDRDIVQRSDDSVVSNVKGRAYPIRRARGFVPSPVILQESYPSVVGLGGELKNTFTVIKDNFAFLSQHMGDMNSPTARTFFRDTYSFFMDFLNVRPLAVCRDLHPAYFTTAFSRELEGMEVVSLQHHRAHIYSLIAECGFRGKGVGVAFDGTGYGEDGTIWGGEFFTIEGMELSRMGHFDLFPLQGGDTTIRSPWKTALSLLFATFGAQKAISLGNRLFRKVPPGHIETVLDAIGKELNLVFSSSCGRLFDGASALTGTCTEATFEGEAAMRFEGQIHAGGKERIYPWKFNNEEGTYIVEYRGIIEGIVEDLLVGHERGMISKSFHDTMADIIVSLSAILRQEVGGDSVLLSGGVFQNLYLVEKVLERLSEKKLRGIIHRSVPPGDGGISLGQALYCAHRKEGG